jgi:hypothetical protein
MMGLHWLQQETTLREDVSDNRGRRSIMGDKGGKKQKSKNKLDKQPKRKP